jgi:hypothetical protein
MDGSDMQQNFANQISMSAHSWTDLILSPYLFTIPINISTSEKDIKDHELKIEYYTN